VSDDGPTPGVEGDSVFDALWEQVLASWDDEARHHAVLGYALQTERLAALAERYRALKDDPARGARAAKKLEAVAMAATQLLLATKSAPPRGVPWPVTALGAAVSLALLVYVLRLLWAR
jgi:hypothetical protein